MSSVSFSAQNKQFLGTAFYGSQDQQKLQLMVFLSGKISEFFIQKTKKNSAPIFLFENQEKIGHLKYESKNDFLFETSFEVFNRKFSIFPHQKTQIILTKFKAQSSFKKQTNELVENSKKLFIIFCEAKNEEKKKQQQNKKIQVSVFQKEIYSSKVQKNNFFCTTFGNDQLCRSSTPFFFAIIL